MSQTHLARPASSPGLPDLSVQSSSRVTGELSSEESFPSPAASGKSPARPHSFLHSFTWPQNQNRRFSREIYAFSPSIREMVRLRQRIFDEEDSTTASSPFTAASPQASPVSPRMSVKHVNNESRESMIMRISQEITLERIKRDSLMREYSIDKKPRYWLSDRLLGGLEESEALEYSEKYRECFDELWAVRYGCMEISLQRMFVKN